MDKYEVRRQALIKLIAKVGGQSKLADKMEVNPSYVSRMLYEEGKVGKKRIGEDMVEKLDQLFSGWLDVSSDESRSNIIPITINKNKDSAEYIINQYHDVRGGMGGGLILPDQPGQITGWKVTPEWIAKNVPSHTGRNNLSIVTGFGDSMKGMYNSGDPIIIDIGITSCDYDGVYFFRIGDEGFIKTLQRIPNDGIRVISENKKYETWTITSDMDFEVFGRVLKVWKSEDF